MIRLLLQWIYILLLTSGCTSGILSKKDYNALADENTKLSSAVRRLEYENGELRRILDKMQKQNPSIDIKGQKLRREEVESIILENKRLKTTLQQLSAENAEIKSTLEQLKEIDSSIEEKRQKLKKD